MRVKEGDGEKGRGRKATTGKREGYFGDIGVCEEKEYRRRSLVRGDSNSLWQVPLGGIERPKGIPTLLKKEKKKSFNPYPFASIALT